MSFWGGGKDVSQNFTDQTSTGVGMTTAGTEGWVKAAGKKAFGKAKNALPKHYKRYTGERVAGYGPTYDQGKTRLQEMMGESSASYGTNKGRLDEQRGFLDQHRGRLDSLAGNPNFSANVSWKDFVDPKAMAELDAIGASPNNDINKTAADWMTPYVGEVLNPQLRVIDEAQKQQDLVQNREATMAGAFGDPQSGLAKASSRNKFNTLKAETTGKTYADAYNQGQQQANTVMQRMMQLPGMRQALRDAGQGQVNTQMNRVLGLNDDYAGLNRDYGALTDDYIGLDKSRFDQDSAFVKALTDFGQADQALDQKHKDVAYSDWKEKRDFGVDKHTAILKMLGLVPADRIGTSASTQHVKGATMGVTPESNDFLQLAGKAVGAAAGGGFKFG